MIGQCDLWYTFQTRSNHPNPPASSPRAGTHSLRYCGSVTCKALRAHAAAHANASFSFLNCIYGTSLPCRSNSVRLKLIFMVAFIFSAPFDLFAAYAVCGVQQGSDPRAKRLFEFQNVCRLLCCCLI